MKSIKLKGNNYWDSEGIVHKKRKLYEILEDDTGWVTVNDLIDFAPYNSNEYNRPRYRRIGKLVEIRGIVSPKNKIEPGESITIFNLPEGYRPSRQVSVICQGSGVNRWQLYINTNGNIDFGRYGTSGNAECPTSGWLPFQATFFVD